MTARWGFIFLEDAPMGPSFGHVAKALAIMAIFAGLWMLGARGPHWMGAAVAACGAWERELAQKWRKMDQPGPPLTMDNIRQAGWPTLVVFAVAGLVELLTG